MRGALLGPSGRYELGTEVVTLGRIPTNTIVIDDSKASGRHAEVRPEGAGYVLVDVGSTNGTLLNGQPLRPQTPQPLHNGDVITIGLARLTVEMEAAGNAYAVTDRVAPGAGVGFAPTERMASAAGGGFAPTQQVAPGNRPGYAGASGYAPPPPPAAAYGAPPGGLPPYVLPPAPRKRSKKKWILLGVGGGLAALVLACTCVGLLIYTIYTHSPEGVTSQYYADIKGQEYAAAYLLLGSAEQQLLSLDAPQNHLATGQQVYIAFFSCLDQQLGPVTAYTTTSRGQQSGRAAVDVNVTRSREQYTDPVRLLQEADAWKIAFFLPPPNQHCQTASAGPAPGI